MEYLILQTEVPYQNEEAMGVECLFNLAHWPWGTQALLANKKAKDYMFSRAVSKPPAIAKRRYELVCKLLE